MRSALLVIAFGLVGCVSFPHARLLSGQAAFEVVTGPVVCGPVGFRKVPLQSRWGEYVRVTVAAPAALRGTVLVHAGGVAQEPRTWNTESTGALVVEARFPNEDVDRRFALDRERPIDLTLTGLEGACEGAVFTVEHGALVPSIDERAWIAELERRGGPELAARRQASRLAADSRRQAHYAQWEARQVEVSAELVAQASLIREAHYAQWESRRASVNAEVVVDAAGEATASNVAGPSQCASGGCAGGAMQANLVGPSVGGVASPCASGRCIGPSAGGVAVSSPCASGTCAGGAMQSTVVGVGGVAASSPCASGACAAPTVGGVAESPVVTAHAPCVTGACAGAGLPAGFEVSVEHTVPSACAPSATLAIHDPAPMVAVSSPGEWSQPSDLSLRATTDTAWGQPPDAQLRASATLESSWSQPFEPRLEPVAVTTESRVATSSPQPVPVPTCDGSCARAEEPALSVLVPALFQVMFHVSSAASQQPAHAAQPLPPGAR